jgi:hypothetical protein
MFVDGESQIEVGSLTREHIERAVVGLDGVVSIDLGGRERKVRQTGEFRTRRKTELNSRVRAISALMDGGTHTLVTMQGETFENLRIDSVNVKNERVSGSGIVADYEIIYTQLMV